MINGVISSSRGRQSPYPRIASGRGKGKASGRQFLGPYPSAYSARDTLPCITKII